MCTLHEDGYTFLIISFSFLLRMRMFQKNVEEIKTNILCSIIFFFNRAVYEVMGKNIVEQGRPQMTIWRMCIAYWVTKVTHMHNV
jgi:hypothetical protein